ncbi:MAG: hypothetical protein KDD53_06060 [Bdellovibrionales bacterium]|nr:hypothetical protein [Bdellovibrionales bacterium]
MRNQESVAERDLFGTASVFFTTISTILGAILFLRFGWATANVGFLGVLCIIAIGHFVTIPTAFAISEIATNQKVEGGGVYYMISRSFGLTIGATIGIGLYLSQAISVAFYVIAFAEAFRPIFATLQETYSWGAIDPRFVSVPTVLALSAMMLLKGAQVGLKILYLVVATLFISLLSFFLGDRLITSPPGMLETINSPESFFTVFAVIFPAFTGLTAGVGLSGDLHDPKTAIPRGTLWATILGLFIYVAVAWKLSVSASLGDLESDQFIMSKISLWSALIPIGLACACFSSALGSILAAPRTLQALAQDSIFPTSNLNSWLAKSIPGSREPINSLLVTILLALFFVAIGDVNFVAQVISMFFMVTYGAICLVSFLEHCGADPAYRPTFRSRWYISLFGGVTCFYLMFQMSAVYALIALISMIILFVAVSHYNPDKRELASVFRGVIIQVSRRLQIMIQRAEADIPYKPWRPSFVCISEASFRRTFALDLLRWISRRYGFGTFIHFMPGYFSKAVCDDAQAARTKLRQRANAKKSNVYIDTLVSPSYTSAISQLVQLPGIAGQENNGLLFEFSKSNFENLDRIIENIPLARAAGFDVCLLGTCEKGFGYRRELHIWITPVDYENASLMILLGFVILGHPDWRKATIKIFAIASESPNVDDRALFLDLIQSGRLPISPNNIQIIPNSAISMGRALINEWSRDADLTMVGVQADAIKRLGTEVFTDYDGVGNILFVCSASEKELVEVVSEEREASVAASESPISDLEPAA